MAKPKKTSKLLRPNRIPLAKQPSKFIDKTTVRLRSTKEPEPIYEQFSFYTKQRPYSWTYYSFARIITYQNTFSLTGNSFDFVPFITIEVPESKAIVLNTIQVNVIPRLNPFSSNAALAPEQVSTSMKGHVWWTLDSSSSSLFEATSLRDGSSLNATGFSEYNTNVLLNGDSSTSIYLEPSSTVQWKMLSFSDATSFYLPADQSPRNTIELEILLRGHSLNRADYEKLLEFQKLGM